MIEPESNHDWSVILAGGDGQRLLPLTRLMTGDDRPKQFCPLLAGGRTLLAETRCRTAKLTPAERTVFVVNRLHQPFYATELAGVSPELTVVQPENRGTLPAILVALARVMEHDEQAVVGFFPCDHDYTREHVFLEGVRRGFRAARARPKSLILLGERATYAETSYGYIEPIQTRRGRTKTAPQPVRRFWEKPSLSVAQTLRQRGCLWNMFVMIGHASAFLDLIRGVAPDAFATVFPPRAAHQRTNLESIYRGLQPSDFSKLVLTKGCSAVSVLDVGDSGWNDLGDPQRMMATLAMRGVRNPWRDLLTTQLSIAAVAS